MITAPVVVPESPALLRSMFAPNLASARAAAGVVRAFFAEHGGLEPELFACELCVAEACSNAVVYAKGAAREEPGCVDFVCDAHALELRVTDHTAGFDWPDPFPTLPGDSDRGRGLFIIHSLMDDVQYLRGAKENVLVMRKKRSGLPLARAVESLEPIEPSLADTQRQLAECTHAISAMARELCFRTETLSAVFRCCAELGRAGASAGFEERLLADMLHLTSADWYVLRLVSPDERELRVAAVSTSELATAPLTLADLGEMPASLEAHVAASRTSVRFDARESLASEPLRAVGANANGVIYPLYSSDALVGTIAVGRRQGDFAFDALHEAVGRTFADFLAIQTAGLRHREQDLQTKLIAHELDIARVIQRSLLPVALPQLSGFGLAGGWHSARDVGGDFYDAIALGEHSLLLVVADVMGKGVPAALFAMNLRGLLRGMSALFEDPAQLLGRLNRLLHEELSAVGMFITAQVAVVDLRKRTVTAAGAGHGPLLYVAEDGKRVLPLATQGMPLGVLPDVDYRSLTVSLGRSGTLLMHTDGLTDMRNAAGEEFGQERLVSWLGANHGRGRSATELRGRLASALNRFRGDTAMTDDQAFLLLAEERVEDVREPAMRLPSSRRKHDTLVPADAGDA